MLNDSQGFQPPYNTIGQILLAAQKQAMDATPEHAMRHAQPRQVMYVLMLNHYSTT